MPSGPRRRQARRGLRQSDATTSGTIVENVLQTLAKANPEDVQYLQRLLAITDRIDRSLDDFIFGKRQLFDGAPSDTLLGAHDKIEKLNVPVGDKVLAKTTSIGVAEFPSDTDGFWQAIKHAAAALYAAQDGGRNRAVRFSPEIWQHGDF